MSPAHRKAMAKPLPRAYDLGLKLYRTPEDKAACRRLKLTPEERAAWQAVIKAKPRNGWRTRVEGETWRTTHVPEILLPLVGIYEYVALDPFNL